MTPITEEMYRAFDERTREHIDKVIYFGKIMGYDFIGHDSTKWDADKVEGFVLSNAIANLGLETDVDDTIIRERAIYNHVKSEPHHPAYWDENCTWEKYTINPKGFLGDAEIGNMYLIDARKMDERSMAEMCADWCAVSDELGNGNTPHGWAKMNLGTRWLVTKEQEDFLYNTLDTMWTAHQNNKANKVTHNSDIDLNLLALKNLGRG